MPSRAAMKALGIHNGRHRPERTYPPPRRWDGVSFDELKSANINMNGKTTAGELQISADQDD